MSDLPLSEQKAIPGRVHFSVDARGVAWLVLDNPRKHNALSLAMWHTVIDVLPALAEDQQVRCLVIRGAGHAAFCAGADLDEKKDADATRAVADSQVTLSGLRALREFAKPTVAMIAGYCLGGGLATALACDLRVTADNASFGIPAARLGIGYFYSELKRLTELVGPARAKQILYTADRYGASDAWRFGLVNEVVPLVELETFTAAFAGRIAANAPLTIAAAKHAIAVALGDPAERDIGGCDERTRACLASADFAEGRRAFAEKRPPVFVGR